MDAARDYYEIPDHAYSSFPNATNNQNVSGGISFQNTTDYGKEESINAIVVINISIVVICIFGAVGNGIVIWLLGFRVKRNPFSTFILNLAIADLGVLLSVTYIVLQLWTVFPYYFTIMFLVFFPLLLSTYSASQFLLMAISIDRCVAVFFPLWHRCHRPSYLSTTVCALIWFLSLLLSIITCFLIFQNLNETIEENHQFFVNALLCLPVMTMATVALSIKICFKTRQQRRGKLLTIILLTLLFFFLFAFPMNIIVILKMFRNIPGYILRGAMLLACLNSSVNPAIYILVGRHWKSRQRENMKMIFQKAFKEEDSCIEETPVETQL